jgi:hypothetical protein
LRIEPPPSRAGVAVGAGAALAPENLPEGLPMSQQIVGEVMTRLLTDEELRVRFAEDPFDTIAELHLRGFALTPNEIDVFVYSDVRLWLGHKIRSVA